MHQIESFPIKYDQYKYFLIKYNFIITGCFWNIVSSKQYIIFIQRIICKIKVLYNNDQYLQSLIYREWAIQTTQCAISTYMIFLRSISVSSLKSIIIIHFFLLKINLNMLHRSLCTLSSGYVLFQISSSIRFFKSLLNIYN